MNEELIIAGFGGQGIILAGRLLAQAAMKAGFEVTYMRSYGAEVRGGTANCMIVISEEPVACPLVSKPGSLIVMNNASLSRFGPSVKSGGLLVVNSSLVEHPPEPTDGTDVLSVPANDLAVELGSVKAANMVALGAYLQRRGILTTEQAADCLPHVLPERHRKTIPLNTAALQRGAEIAQTNA
jgi:2-oxoglutarate ferredoxin oxidoreductase subunit gamma